MNPESVLVIGTIGDTITQLLLTSFAILLQVSIVFSYGIDNIKTSEDFASEKLSWPVIFPVMLFPYASWAVILYLLAASLALCSSLEPITMSCPKHHLRAKPSPIPPVPPTIPILIILEIIPVKILSFSN